MEGPLALLPCVSVTQYRRCPDCADDRSCELRKIFREVRNSSAAILDGWTLADAQGKASPPEYVLGTSAQKKARRRTAPKEGSSNKGAARSSQAGAAARKAR